MNASAHSVPAPAIPFWRSAIVPVLAGLTVGACFWGAAPVSVSESGVNMHLPEKVGGYTGREMEVSESERTILPADTEFAKVLYSDASGQEISCQIVLAGAEKRSIHRPEVCLKGQGWTLKSQNVETVPLSDGSTLDVMKMIIGRQVSLTNGEQKELTSIFTYWFAGKNSTTPHHLERILKTNLDMLLRNTNHRWAYIIVSAPVLDGFVPGGKNEEQTLEAINKFIGKIGPEIMLSKK